MTHRDTTLIKIEKIITNPEPYTEKLSRTIKKNGGIPDALHNLLHTYSSCRESTHQAIHQGKMSGLTTKQ